MEAEKKFRKCKVTVLPQIVSATMYGTDYNPNFRAINV